MKVGKLRRHSVCSSTSVELHLNHSSLFSQDTKVAGEYVRVVAAAHRNRPTRRKCTMALHLAAGRHTASSPPAA